MFYNLGGKMKYIITTALCLRSFNLLAADQGAPQVGRYQMVGVSLNNDAIQLYLLDTATGLVWKSARKNNWVEHDCWQLQIATEPKQ